ncbi:MAG: hypothetical protein JO069_15440, partial [Verrucomicrobia bacterium]|nr:hypothetical protein [Verrucomicrobiota bacterium]
MQVVAGLNLKNLHPRVWDATSPFYQPALRAAMVSYADFDQLRPWRRAAMERGLHAALSIPVTVRLFLDNGAFYFARRGRETPTADYEEFVAAARPDWKPIPYDSIPAPKMPKAEQRLCLQRTMEMNRAFEHDGFVPVIHISEVLVEYIEAVQQHEKLSAKPSLALGGIVPHLLRTTRSRAYRSILADLRSVRQTFAD